MVKMTRNAIGCLLSTNENGELPPLGPDMFVTISYATHRKERGVEPSSLDLASDYYQSLQELTEKGLVSFESNAYRLTEDGRKFLCELRGRWGEYAL